MHSARFVDQSPAEVYATLLEEQTYLCSPRTMYRVLAEADEVRERRDQVRHPAYVKPELVASAPNQVWSWDITKLKGPVPYLYYSLYVIVDLFSRYVVGWMVAVKESAHLAQRLIEQTCAKQRIQPQQLTIHADRGAPMRSKLVALLFSDLGIAASHSRPRVSNDNPFDGGAVSHLQAAAGVSAAVRLTSWTRARQLPRPAWRWYKAGRHHSGLRRSHAGRRASRLSRRWQSLDLASPLTRQRGLCSVIRRDSSADHFQAADTLPTAVCSNRCFENDSCQGDASIVADYRYTL